MSRSASSIPGGEHSVVRSRSMDLYSTGLSDPSSWFSQGAVQPRPCLRVCVRASCRSASDMHQSSSGVASNQPGCVFVRRQKFPSTSPQAAFIKIFGSLPEISLCGILPHRQAFPLRASVRSPDNTKGQPKNMVSIACRPKGNWIAVSGEYIC